MDQFAALLAAIAGAFLLTGGSGLVARVLGLRFDGWDGTFCAATGAGLGLAANWLWERAAWWREKQTAIRLDEAKAWHNELDNQARELAIQAALAPQPATGTEAKELKAKAEAMDIFFRAGDALGFSLEALQSAGVVGQPTWKRLTDFYCSAAGKCVLRDVGGNVGTQWGHGWDKGDGLDDVLRGLALGTFPLPPGAVPVVEPPTLNATKRNARQKGSTRERKTDAEPGPASRAVVEGVVSGERA